MLGFTALFAASATAAQPTRTAWSTYLRAGPGDTFTVIDELEHDAPVVVEGGQGRWRRVSSGALHGYVDADALALPGPPRPDPAAHKACVVTGQTDERRPMPTRFCSAASAKPKAGG